MVGIKGRSGKRLKYAPRKIRALMNLMRVLNNARRSEVSRRLGWGWVLADKYMNYLVRKGYLIKKKNIYYLTKAGVDKIY